MFGSLGVPELLLIFAVILIVFGPRRIPEIGRTLGKALGEFRKATDDLKNTIEREVRIEELKKITPPSLGEMLTPPESVSRSAPPVVTASGDPVTGPEMIAPADGFAPPETSPPPGVAVTDDGSSSEPAAAAGLDDVKPRPETA
jgi:sec-independent protein translocase protein TatA